ncbi:hypothetical protein BK144_04315 [Paenibacillus sp. FSL R7-0273]|nr:hypothetical protein BK144_04315 [Paenibacillus sp. FSL R7-0273]
MKNVQNSKRGTRGIFPLLQVAQVKPFLNQTVDFTLNSGERLCGVFIHSVSPETNPNNSTYGAFTYLFFQNGKFHMVQNNVANVSQIGLSGSICL